MRSHLPFLAGLLASAFVSATEPRVLQRHDFSGPGMATTFRLSFYAGDKEEAAEAADACFARIAELNAIFTDYDPTSELMRLCAPEAKYPMAVSPELFDLLQKSRRLAELTGGAFDPTCGHLSQLWRRAKRQGKLPPSDRLQKALAATDWRRIRLHPAARSVTLDPGTLLDMGGIAKGYAADECLSLLRERGFSRAVVIAGGDVAIGAPPPAQDGWEVKLRTFSKPGPDEILETAVLASQGVSTSGDLYQFVELEGQRYSHILDTRTGLGLTKRIACTVFATDCATSDALATALCVLGEEEGNLILRRIPGARVRFARPLSR